MQIQVWHNGEKLVQSYAWSPMPRVGEAIIVNPSLDEFRVTDVHHDLQNRIVQISVEPDES